MVLRKGINMLTKIKEVRIPSKNIYRGNLILVNQEHPYREETQKVVMYPVQECKPELVLERHSQIILHELLDQIEGWSSIQPISGWRSREEQVAIWNQTLLEHGENYTRTYVAKPGYSEHQTGLAIDLGLKQEYMDFICPEFPYEGICQKFRELAPKFGFVERYPKGKEHITGIGHEPWHFRYVGVPHAQLMTELELTLEEYMEYLMTFSYGENPLKVQVNGAHIEIGHVWANPQKDTSFYVEPNIAYNISGTNIEGFIITTWRL